MLLLFQAKFHRTVALLTWSYIIAPAFVLSVSSARSDSLTRELHPTRLLSVHGNSRARIPEWVSSSFSRESS